MYFDYILDKIVQKKLEEKLKRSIICDVTIEKGVNEIFEDLYNEGVEEESIQKGK